jgi:hypothetical protein
MMSQSEALAIIQENSTSMGLGLLETMDWMQNNLQEVDSVEKCAFRTVFDGFQQFFAEKH